MKILPRSIPIVAGTAALIAGIPAARAEPVHCSADVLSAAGSRVAGSLRCAADVVSVPGSDRGPRRAESREPLPPGCASAAPETDPVLAAFLPVVPADPSPSSAGSEDPPDVPQADQRSVETEPDCDGFGAFPGSPDAPAPEGGSDATRSENAPHRPGPPEEPDPDASAQEMPPQPRSADGSPPDVRSGVPQPGGMLDRPRSAGALPDVPVRDDRSGGAQLLARPRSPGNSPRVDRSGATRQDFGSARSDAPAGALRGRSAAPGASPGVAGGAGRSPVPIGPPSGDPHGRAAGPGGPAAAKSPVPRKPPVFPQIVPGPSGSAPAGSKLTTLTQTGPLRAGRESWAAMIGAAIVAEAGLLWLVVGLALRRGRSRVAAGRRCPARSRTRR
jgi:hypothetical protein